MRMLRGYGLIGDLIGRKDVLGIEFLCMCWEINRGGWNGEDDERYWCKSGKDEPGGVERPTCWETLEWGAL